jgi:hypothetical protein
MQTSYVFRCGNGREEEPGVIDKSAVEDTRNYDPPWSGTRPGRYHLCDGAARVFAHEIKGPISIRNVT